MNAHINHDLPAAVVSTCEATGAGPERGTPRYADYMSINSTLAGLIELARRQLMVRLPGDEVPPLHNLEDLIAGWSISAARENAWTNAEVLWTLRGLPLEARYLDSLDGIAAVAGKAMLTPVPAAAGSAA